jgi:hypothetical protein
VSRVPSQHACSTGVLTWTCRGVESTFAACLFAFAHYYDGAVDEGWIGLVHRGKRHMFGALLYTWQ